jgi:hypothetical protein
MKKFGRNLILAFVLAGTSGAGAIAYASPTNLATNTQTGTDPVPPVPPSKSSSIVITVFLTWLGVIL